MSNVISVEDLENSKNKTITVKTEENIDGINALTPIRADLTFRSLGDFIEVSGNVKGIVKTSDLKLDIWLPGEIFSEIKVKGSSAKVEINSGVTARLIRVETFSGNIVLSAIFIKAVVKSNAGNVNMYINAQSRVDTQISTLRGDINIFPRNVRKVNLVAKSKYGEVLNKNRGQHGYIVSIKATSTNGNITVE